MKKSVRITEEQLIQIIESSLEQHMGIESDEIHQPEFTEKVFDFMRSYPKLTFKRLYDLFGEDSFQLLNAAKNQTNLSEATEIDLDDEEEDDYDPNKPPLFPVNDDEFELDEYDIDEIFSYKGPKRVFRGSIYMDGIVPETDDREYDRKVALKVVDYASKVVPFDSYVGGVGFKQRGNIIEPYDKDF